MPPMPPKITKHAHKRIKQRLGLPKRAVERNAENAWNQGRKHKDYTGSFKRYLDSIFLRERTASEMRILNGYIYIFTADALITVYIAPQRYRNAAA